MGTVLADFRRMVSEPTSTTYSDDLLQGIADRYRTVHKRIAIRSSDKDTPYYDYEFPRVVGQWVEQNETGSGWELLDSNDAAAPSYTVNYYARTITFTADTANTEYYLSCRSYDLNLAAAHVWREKAAAVAQNIDFSTDNHAFQASQKKAAYLDMAAYYESLGGAQVLEMYRGDMM